MTGNTQIDAMRILDRSISDTKSHTIRSGHRWKTNEHFSPCVWSGKPYRIPQIIFTPDIEIKKIRDFESEVFDYGKAMDRMIIKLDSNYSHFNELPCIAKNVGRGN